MEFAKLCFDHPFSTFFFIIALSTVISALRGTIKEDKKKPAIKSEVQMKKKKSPIAIN